MRNQFAALPIQWLRNMTAIIVTTPGEDASMRLCDAQPGQTVRIIRLTSERDMRRRLMDLGFVAGARVDCVGRSPGGDPACYRILGSIIAIRDADGSCISVSNC